MALPEKPVPLTQEETESLLKEMREAANWMRAQRGKPIPRKDASSADLQRVCTEEQVKAEGTR
jgi:hypothetical protein